MNYDEARERKGPEGKGIGLWDWTTKNDSFIRPAPPCSKECEHHSAEDAELHFYNFCLEQTTVFTYSNEQHKCQVCGDWTQKGMGNNYFGFLSFHAHLCESHLNREELRKLFPFKPGIQVIHS